MSEVDDLVPGDLEPETISLLDIIENQLTVIETVKDLPTDSYDKLPEDVIKCLSLAFRVIQKAQVKLLKTI